MAFQVSDYTSGKILTTSMTALNYSTYDVTVTGTLVTSGIDLTITVRNKTGTNQPSVNMLFPIGAGVSGTDPYPSSIWLADYAYKRRPMGVSGYLDSTRSSEFGQNYYASGAANRSLNIPVMAVDDGAKVYGVSTNYPYFHSIRTAMISGTTYGFDIRTYKTYYASAEAGFEGPRDFYTSGETRTWNVWLREASGVMSTGLAMSTHQPFIDWVSGAYPYNRPPRVTGKIYGYFLSIPGAATSGNPRNYSVSSGIQPWATGVTWSQILDNHIPSVADLKSRGFNGVMFWAAAGFELNEIFAPADFRTLPGNLKNSVSEVRDWALANDMKVYIYQGGGYSYYQTGDWDSPILYAESGQTYFGGTDTINYPQFNITGAQRVTIYPSAIREWNTNNRDGWMVWSDGMAYDAALDVFKNSGALPLLQELRQAYPNKMIMAENMKTIYDQSLRQSAVYPTDYFEPYRCPLQERIHPGFQNFAIFNRFEYPYTASGRLDWLNILNQAESVGLCVITLTDPDTFYYIPQTGPLNQLNEAPLTSGNKTNSRRFK